MVQSFLDYAKDQAQKYYQHYETQDDHYYCPNHDFQISDKRNKRCLGLLESKQE